MKKNTLLYLEKSLVERAKKSHLNISEITEGALRAIMNEYRTMNDPSYIFENSVKCFLPYRIDKISFKNHSVFKNNSYSFKQTNLITGNNASGKTTVINFLKEKYDPSNLPNGEKMMLHIDGLLGLNQAILMDDVLSRLNRENLIKTLNKLSNSERQVILTLKDYEDISKVNANIIKTKNFELKQ